MSEIEDITDQVANAPENYVPEAYKNLASEKKPAEGGPGYGGASLVRESSPGALKTIADALKAVADECKQDKFWADMAKPIDRGIERFRAAARAQEKDDAEAVKKYRQEGMEQLNFANDQFKTASENRLFTHEASMVALVVKHLADDASMTLDSPLSQLAAAAHADQAKNVEHRKELMGTAAAPLQKVREHMRPYEFHCAPDETEMTVTIKVPPGTKTTDCQVELRKDTIKIRVKDHPNQPYVIDGRFCHAIDPTMSEWHLEGSGDKRVMILDLENTHAGVDWSAGMLKIGA